MKVLGKLNKANLAILDIEQNQLFIEAKKFTRPVEGVFKDWSIKGNKCKNCGNIVWWQIVNAGIDEF